MGDGFSELQAANIVPPRDGGVLAFALDTTSRAKDLSSLTIQGAASSKGGSLRVVLYADVDWYLRLSSVNTGTVSEATVDIATAPITLAATAAIKVAAGQPIVFRIDRSVDNYLLVKGSAAGTVRGWFCSEIKGLNS